MAFGILSLSLVWALAGASPCRADNFHSYVSANGAGTACTLTAPCATFGGALAVTRDGGDISCLTGGPSGSIQGINIAQSVTIDCPDFTAVVTINGTGVVVTLRNMTIDGFGGSSTGIDFKNGAALFVENCVIDNFDTGIHFAPSGGTAKLFVTDSVIKNNGASAGGGIVVEPANGAVANITIERTKVENSRLGISAAGVGAVHGVVRDSVVSDNDASGIGVHGLHTILLIENTTVAGNQTGLAATNRASMLVGHSSVVLNRTGLSVADGGTLSSYKNNNVNHNTTDGAFTTTIAQK
jgi:hypothetical protein